MASLLKQAKRGLRRRAGHWLHASLHSAPDGLRKKLGPALCYLEMLVLDYGITRVLYNNRHKISGEAWRSAQPAPHHIRLAARRGVRTVINLRSDQSFGTRWLEERSCEHHGLKLVNLTLRSRAAPSRKELFDAKKLLERVGYPVLIHCKSGSDRAGLMSALYRIVHLGEPVGDARKELGLKYGHVRQADTGVLDYFFERYLADNARNPIGFWTWVETVYDPDEIKRTFHASSLANRLVNNILHRE